MGRAVLTGDSRHVQGIVRFEPVDNMTFDVVSIASFNADLVSRVPRPIAPGETLKASAFEITPGGKGSNAGVAAARQGARVALIARIGNDDFGGIGLDLWRREGIDTTHVEIAAGETSGVAQILVYDDGDNSIAVYAGATAGLSARNAQAARATLASCRVVIATCEVPLAVTLEAFRIARAAGAITVLNPAPAQPLPGEVLAMTHVLTPNETEAPILAAPAGDATVDAAAHALLGRGARAVLVTLGAAGCVLYRNGSPPLRQLGRRTSVVDTIGAGDTFNGALAAALARGDPLAEATRWANAAAALSVTGRGAIGGMPTLDQVRAVLAQDD
jgi:ribokinase